MSRALTLSPPQQHVLARLRAGWELGETLTMDGGWWLQQGGCGSGGASEPVHAATAHALLTRGCIVLARRQFPLATYRLAP